MTAEHRVNLEELQERAVDFNAIPRPFVRWVGSKRAALRYIVALLPSRFRRYYEPFLGSGALFFLLEPENALVSDASAELIETYRQIRDNVASVARYLHPLRPDPDLFYRIRKQPSRGTIKRAAEFIYLNKTCWNGLYRVNSKGRFNVPYGRPRTTSLVDFENLRACARALSAPGIQIKACDFSEALIDVQKGDLVYLDPPYVTRHNNNGFVDYNEKLFSWEDQRRLADFARHLAARGAYVIVTNAAHQDILALYRGFAYRVFERPSTLAADVVARGRVTEALLYTRHSPHPG